jgi:hypothetical protein
MRSLVPTIGPFWVIGIVSVMLAVPELPIGRCAGSNQHPSDRPRIEVRDEALIDVGPDAPAVEPYIAVDPSDRNHLVAASIAFGDPGRAFTSIVFSSFDGGKHWQRGIPPELETTPLRFSGDVWLSFGKGAVFFSCLTVDGHGGSTQIYRSTDGGRSWGGPVRLPSGDGGSFDRPTITVDRTGSRYDGNIYVLNDAWHKRGALGLLSQPSVSRSTDGGNSFSDPVWIHNSNLTTSPAGLTVLSDGSLVVGFEDYATVSFKPLNGLRLWTSVSTDGGVSFSSPRFVAELHPPDLSRFKYAAVCEEVTSGGGAGGFRDRLYMVWADYHDRSTDIFCASSADRGETWSEGVRVNDNLTNSDQCIPAIAVNSAGIVGVTWMDRRNSSDNSCYEAFFSASLDGGASFLPNAKVSRAISCPKTAGNVFKYPNGTSFDVFARWPAGGDYSGLAAQADGTFRLCWSDSRTGKYRNYTAVVAVRPAETLPRGSGHQ